MATPKYHTAVIDRRSAATNEQAPLSWSLIYFQRQLSTPPPTTAHYWPVRQSECIAPSTLRVGQYGDQSSSHGLEKFGEDIPTSPKVTCIRAHMLNFRPKFKFLQFKFFFRGTPVPVGGALGSLGQSLMHVKIWGGSTPQGPIEKKAIRV